MAEVNRIFVNSDWAKKDPTGTKSPQGTPLEFGVNAFASIKNALTKYPDDLGSKEVILLDKKSTVNNTIKGAEDVNVDFTYLASQEVDKLGSVKDTTATSKVNAAGELSLTYNEDSAPAETTVSGFLNVNIATRSDAEPNLTVLGGKSTVSHSFTEVGTKIKETASISTAAAGTLSVTNSHVAVAGGAFATVIEGEGYDISQAEPAFKVYGVGEPEDVLMPYGDPSKLEQLSGYTTVSLTYGASADMLYGATKSYSGGRDVKWDDDADPVSITKNYSASSKAAGSLTADSSTFGFAEGYATVEIKGTDWDFGSIDAYTVSETEKSNYTLKKTDKGYRVFKTTQSSFSGSYSKSAAGKVSISGAASGTASERNISGYSTVSIKGTTQSPVTVGNVTAGSYKKSSSETDFSEEKEPLISTVHTLTLSKNAALAGTLQADYAEVADVVGFSKITLDHVTVNGGISASAGDWADGFAGDYKLTENETRTNYGFPNDIIQSKSTESGSFTAGGTVTLTGGIVGADVEGYATVTAVGTEFDGGIVGGKRSDSDTNAFSQTYDAKTEVTTTTDTDKDASESSATGKLTLTDSSVDYDVEGYAAVTAVGTVFDGGIVGGFTTKTATEWSQTYNDDASDPTRQSKNIWTNSSTASGTVTLTGGSVNGSILGYATITGAGVDLTFSGQDQSITGGKGTTTTTEASVTTVKEDVVTKVETAVDSGSGSAVGKLTLTASSIDGGSENEIHGFQTVTFTGVEGEVEEILGGSGSWSETEKNTLVGNILTARTVKNTQTEAATGTFTLTDGVGLNFTAQAIKGFSKVTADYGTFGKIYRIDPNHDVADKQDFSLTYSKDDKKTATKASASATFSATGSVELGSDVAVIDEGIVGFATVKLSGAQVNGKVDGLARTGSVSLATELNAADEWVSSSWSESTKDTASLSLTASNGAVFGNVIGVKTAVISKSTAGNIDAYAEAGQETWTVNLTKNDDYTGTHTGSSSKTATATVTVSKSEVGSISGASKITATESTLGALDSWNEEESWQKQITGKTVATKDSGLEDEKLGDLQYACVERDDTVTKYVETYTKTTTAKASASITGVVDDDGNVVLSEVGGSIEGFGTVTLDKGHVYGRVLAGTYKEEYNADWTFDEKTEKGVYTETDTVTKDVTGSFTAKKSIIDGDVEGFATVTLDEAFVNGGITGGKTVKVMTSEAKDQADYISAEAAAYQARVEKETVTAAGTLKAADAAISGAIANFKSVTFSGDNEVRGGIYGITGEKDTVTIAAKSALTLTANAVLGNKEAKKQIGTLTINGVLRIAVASADAFTFSVENVSGKGTIAIQKDDYLNVLSKLSNASLKTFDIVNGGDEYAIKAVRSVAEELADNEQKKATAMKVGDEVHGWLSGQDENLMFEDTEDWFSFARGKSAYEVVIELDDQGRKAEEKWEIQAALWDGEKEIASGVTQTDYGYRIGADVLSNYASVQLQLSVADDVDPISYRVYVTSVA